jgi:hypothetical protein
MMLASALSVANKTSIGSRRCMGRSHAFVLTVNRQTGGAYSRDETRVIIQLNPLLATVSNAPNGISAMVNVRAQAFRDRVDAIV